MINPPPPFPPTGDSYQKSLRARVLITLAAVWLFLTGGCTLVFSAAYGLDGQKPYGLPFLIMILIFGLVCMLPGLIALAVGLWLGRRARRRGLRAR